MREVVPKLSRLAIIFNGGNAQPVLEMGETEAAARTTIGFLGADASAFSPRDRVSLVGGPHRTLCEIAAEFVRLKVDERCPHGKAGNIGHPHCLCSGAWSKNLACAEAPYTGTERSHVWQAEPSNSTWDAYERAYKDVTAKVGKILGLKGRWLAHAVDDPDAGYTMSLWESEAAIRSYENGEILQKTILPQLTPFFSRDYTTTRCEVRLAEEF